ncbi:glutamate receptor-like [Homarus americanus]|uniref:glutamate receptor-like n=1 Tax=Homarus americanus TaxID=6706 RepID=UPI001C455B83|nr:glutamate receptor-like [Homarus americanus]
MSIPARALLRIAAEEWVPWTKIDVQENGTVGILGPMAHLLDIFADKLNFDYELVRPSDRVWGGPQSDGSWTGMLGMLQRQEVEFAIGPFGVTALRETVCDFSDPVYSENNAILMVRPTLQNDFTGFVKPFTIKTWVWTLVSLVTVVVMMALVVKAEARVFTSQTRHVLSKAAMWGVKTLTQESSEWLPKNDGGRLIVTTWLLASLVFMTSYGGILTAMLTVPRVTIPINSLADLVSQTDLPWRLEAGSMMFQYFKESQDEVRQKVFTEVAGTFPDCWAARKAIANGEFAAICDRTTMKKAMSWDFSTSGQCHLYISSENVYSNAIISMAFKNNSTYLSDANRIIRTVKESGILDKWLAAEITNTTQCLRPPTSDRGNAVAALNVDVMAGPFLVLVGGLTVGLLVFLSELTAWSLCGLDK